MPPRKRTLRAVATDEQPPTPLTVIEAAEAGDRLAELKAMRVRIAKAIADPNTPARDLAALTRRQFEMGKEIEAIELAESEERSVIAHTDDEAWDGTGY